MQAILQMPRPSEWINSITKNYGRKHAQVTGFLYYNQGLIYLKQVNFCNTLCTVYNSEWQSNRAVREEGEHKNVNWNEIAKTHKTL